MSAAAKSGATREPNEPASKDATTEIGGGSSPSAPDQPPEFDPDDEEQFGQFRRYMDRYYGELERIVDAEPPATAKPDAGGGTGTPASAAGGAGVGELKPGKAEKDAPSPAFTPQPSGGSLFNVLLGTSKAKRPK